MRVQIKHALPLVQMGLAVVFLRLEFLHAVAQRQADSPGVHPAFILLLLLDLPVTAPLKLAVYGLLPTLWFDALLVFAIGVFWYWFALGLHSYHERKILLPFRWAPARIIGDVLLVAAGVFVACLLLGEVRDFPNSLSPSALGWPWAIPIWASSLLWSLGPVFVFGQDLIQRARGPLPVNDVSR